MFNDLKEDSKFNLQPSNNEGDAGASSLQTQNDPSLAPAGGNTIQISSSFGPTGAGNNPSAVDIILLSSDGVVFYVNEDTLLSKSNNSFKSLLPLASKESLQRTLFLADIPSPELQIILRVIHGVEIDTSPSIEFQALVRAIDHFPVYGIQASTYVTPTSRLYGVLLSYAPLRPLEIYATAAHHNIVRLAVTVSSHTLSLDLSQVDEELCTRMGPVYLMRLFQLHQLRTETLKKLLFHELGLHNPVPKCDFDGQKVLKGMWNLAVAEMLPDLKPGEFFIGISVAFSR
ncbi:hypothetical protein AAF712_011054 [Marasmius tenuissimus]|uniref:BTB domain-containing protein n=1 Tax=Marasmius tenuissimus TaxID=585030 RepID=A0ABR2ZP12_9AGAR